MNKKSNQSSSCIANIRKDIKRLLTTQLFAVLATTDGEKPHASIISYAMVDNNSAMLFITPKESIKYRNISKSPFVSLVIDERPESSATIASSQALTIKGKVIKIHEKDLYRFSRIFIKRHPSLKPYIMNSDFALVFVKVKKYAYVNSLNNVTRVSANQLAKATQVI